MKEYGTITYDTIQQKLGLALDLAVLYSSEFSWKK